VQLCVQPVHECCDLDRSAGYCLGDKKRSLRREWQLSTTREGYAMTIHGNRGISRQILAAILAFWAGVCAAYEPKVQLNDVAEFIFGRYEDGYATYYIDEFDPDFDDLAD